MCLILHAFQFQSEIHSNRHPVCCEEDIVHEVYQCREQGFPFSGKFFSNFLIRLCHLLLTRLVPDL